MATILRDGDLSLLSGTVAVIGYGSQGHAHAELHDSGVRVVVGLREGSSSRSDAEEAGLEVRSTSLDVVRGAGRLALLPDQVQPAVFTEFVEPNLEPDAASSSRTASMSSTSASPRRRARRDHGGAEGPGHVVRRLFTEGFERRR